VEHASNDDGYSGGIGQPYVFSKDQHHWQGGQYQK